MKYVLTLLVLSSLLSAQVPASLSGGAVAFTIPLVEFGGKIGWNFSLYGGGGVTNDPNQFSYNQTDFTLTSSAGNLIAVVTGKVGKSKIVPSNSLGCYYVRFHLVNPELQVYGSNGTLLKTSIPSSVEYWQEYCDLEGVNFWSAGGLTAIAPK